MHALCYRHPFCLFGMGLPFQEALVVPSEHHAGTGALAFIHQLGFILIKQFQSKVHRRIGQRPRGMRTTMTDFEYQ